MPEYRRDDRKWHILSLDREHLRSSKKIYFLDSKNRNDIFLDRIIY